MNDTHELLFLVATEFIDLSDRQRLEIGLKLGLVNIAAACYSPKHLEEQVFANAFKQNKMASLIKEIEKVKIGTKESSTRPI